MSITFVRRSVDNIAPDVVPSAVHLAFGQVGIVEVPLLMRLPAREGSCGMIC